MKKKPFQRHVQPWLDSNPQQASLRSLKNLQPDARAFVIILKAEALLIDSHQVVFEGCFKIQMESRW